MYTALIAFFNSSKLLAICSFVALVLPNNSLANPRASSLFSIVFWIAGFISVLRRFLFNSALANAFVTSASEATCVNSALATSTAFPSFVTSSFSFCPSTFFSSSFLSNALVLASVTTVLSACTIWTCSSTSVCLAASFANTLFAVANTSCAVAIAIPSESWTNFNFSSKVVMLAFKISLSTFIPTFDTSLSLVFFSTSLENSFVASGIFPVVIVLSITLLFDTFSLACATDPTPKKILAPITIDTAPTLNFLIEYVSFFIPLFISLK